MDVKSRLIIVAAIVALPLHAAWAHDGDSTPEFPNEAPEAAYEDAPNPPARPDWFAGNDEIDYNGFYVGLNAGYGINDSNYTVAMGKLPADNIYEKGDIGSKAWNGGAHVGFNAIVTPSFLLGIELAGEYNDAKGNEYSSIFHTVKNYESFSFKKKNAIAADVRIGIFPVENVLTYLTVGVERAKWDTHYVPLSTIETEISDHKNFTSLQYGLGVELPISCHWLVGGEWMYTDYNGSLTIHSVGRSPFATTTVFPSTLKFEPESSEFRLRLTYLFC